MTLNQQLKYQALKSRFIQLLNEHRESYQLSDVLICPVFSKIINSPREYSSIRRIEDLICLLEMRNAVNVNNVARLAQICGLIILQNGQRWIRDAQNLVNVYKESVLSPNCQFCGLKNDHNHKIQEIEKETRNANPSSSLETVERKSVHNNNNIGSQWWDRVGGYCDWNVLRRLPGLTEKDLNRFRKKYSEEYGECQRKAFEYWLQKGGENVKLETLLKALTDSGNGQAVKILLGIH